MFNCIVSDTGWIHMFHNVVLISQTLRCVRFRFRFLTLTMATARRHCYAHSAYTHTHTHIPGNGNPPGMLCNEPQTENIRSRNRGLRYVSIRRANRPDFAEVRNQPRFWQNTGKRWRPTESGSFLMEGRPQWALVQGGKIGTRLREKRTYKKVIVHVNCWSPSTPLNPRKATLLHISLCPFSPTYSKGGHSFVGRRYSNSSGSNVLKIFKFFYSLLNSRRTPVRWPKPFQESPSPGIINRSSPFRS